jgi:hypothetical protein
MKRWMFALIVAAGFCLAPAAHAQSVGDTLCSTLGVGCPPSFSAFICSGLSSCSCPSGVAVNGGGLCPAGSTPVGWGPGTGNFWHFFCAPGATLYTRVLCQN